VTSSRPTRGRRTSDPGGTRRQRKRRRQTRRRRSRRTLLIAALIGIPVVAIIAGTVGATAVFGSRCDLSSLTPVAVGQNSFVYAADGSELGVIPAERNRTPVTRAQISPWVPKATVAIEDRRFYSHGGVDPVGIARAVVADIRAGKVVQGGSTITQELVRNLYLSRERTLKRKLIEACLSIKLSRQWSKDAILTAYLNQVFYGNHAYGIEAAAETYYSRKAKDLTLDQAALLAGLPQAPSSYDPFRNPTAARERRNEVLRAMLVSGDITSTEFARAKAQRDLGLKPGKRFNRIREPYFFGYVQELLQKEYGSNTVREGGLKVYTTINPGLQRAAQAAITHVLTEPTDPASALISIDPRTGAIKAMAAVSPSRRHNQYNFATSARRQPGSTFKAMTLTAAVARGMDPFHTSYLSAPLIYNPDPAGTCQNKIAWCVQTYEHSYHGVESVASATVQSDNTVFARLALDVGPENIVSMARKLGIRTSPLKPFPSITLGTETVTPLELASAYATLASGGVYSKPMAITKVVLPNGKVDTDAGWGQSKRERVIPDWVASTVTQVLEQNMLYGTGRGAHVYNHTDAGKTGTTDNYADAWFSGYTPRLVATVWMGYPQGEIPMLSVHGITVSGPTFPAQIWHLYMDTAIGSRADVPFPPARTDPVWTSWRGQYQYSGAYSSGYSSSGYSSSSSGSSSSGSDSYGTPTSGTTTAARTHAPTAPAPQPATTATPAPAPPPPVVTTAETPPPTVAP
jgi:penicillin-binding protein 1A